MNQKPIDPNAQAHTHQRWQGDRPTDQSKHAQPVPDAPSLVTADPYSKFIDSNDRVTSLLFGDAASATWLSADAIWDIGKPLLATDGSGGEHLAARNGTLEMNGRQVFNFAALRVPPQIKELLLQENLEPDSIDLYCIHQGSAAH